MQEQNKPIQNTKKRWYRNIPLLTIAGLVVGAAGGWLYYDKVGCVTGSCGITSNPWMSTAWGGALGYLLFDVFKREKKKSSDIHEQHNK
ncbi:MAG: hypothetical protein FJY07_01750 [Bacteroidetes bacterium]|nr:hypothetical protein [Bacteroidota bacterium]